MVDIEQFRYPLPDDEADRVIKEHDEAWQKYWLDNSRMKTKPVNSMLYKQAYIEKLYCREDVVVREPYSEIAFVKSIRSKPFDNPNGQYTIDDLWAHITAEAEKMAYSVHPVWTMYGEMLIDYSFDALFKNGYYYNYYKAIACGKNPKEAYYMAVSRAMDRML